MKLKAKFTLIVSIFVITMLALTAFLAFSHYKKSIRETIAQQQFRMISILADEIDSKLLTAQQHLIAVAKTAPPDIMQHTEKAQAFLDNRPSLHTMFDNHLFLFTPSGKIFVESPYTPGRRGFDLSFREYIINTLKTKKPCISDPYVSSQPHKHPVIMLTVPLFDGRGKIKGILTGSIDLMRDNFLGSISTVKIGKTGYFYLTAADRNMIMHPDRKKILTKQAPGLNRLYDKAIEGFEGTGDTITSYGIEMVSSSKRMKAKNWILLANDPSVEAYRPIRVAEQYFLAATITGIIAVFFIISLIIRYLTKPLELFTRHVEDLPQKTGGDRFLDIKAKDEIGTLSLAFNKMVTEIDKRSELERSEELYRTVIQFATDFVFWRAPDNKIIYVSENCEKFCGYREEEFYASPELLERMIHPDDRTIWAEHTHDISNKGICEDLELRIVTKSGQVRWIAHSCLPVYDREGNYRGRRASHRDITGRKQVEEALKKAHDELEHRVEERTAALNAANTALTAEITERKKGEQEIEQSLKEKEALLREIHHRVKNNMAVVSSLLYLQSKKMENATVRSLFEESQQRVRSMALVHEKLYQTKDLSSVNFEDYIKSIISEIISLYRIDTGAITMEINVEDIELDLEAAVPCGLIINELLTNALKYAFPDNRSGVLSVHFTKAEDTYTLSIKDNGAGLPEGFDYKETSTLGLRLVTVLTGQLRGTFQIKSDEGTEAIVTFKTKRD
ncbi:MAG: PAS domain-containing protein [Nitrospirae bacterium]|nr:PAS domain-containing protein [Nitrospirota bacterium]